MGKNKNKGGFAAMFRKTDQFGQKVSDLIKFDQKEKYQTLVGASASMLMFIILIVFFGTDLVKVYRGETKTISVNEHIIMDEFKEDGTVDVEGIPQLDLGDKRLNFNMAFGIVGDKKGENVVISPAIGQFYVQHVTKERPEHQATDVDKHVPHKKVVIEQALYKCSTDKHWEAQAQRQGQDQGEGQTWRYNNLECSNGFRSSKLQGDFFSSGFKYVKFGFRSCNYMPSKKEDDKKPKEERTQFQDGIVPDWYAKPVACASKPDQIAGMQGKNMNIVYIDSYQNVSKGTKAIRDEKTGKMKTVEDKDAIRYFIVDHAQVGLIGGIEHTMNFFLHAGKFIKYNWLGLKQEPIPIHMMGATTSTDKHDKFAEFSGFLRLNEMEKNVDQKTYMILDVLSALGGLKISLAGGFSVLVLLVSKKFFENDILGSLFLVKKRNELHGDEEDMPQGESDVEDASKQKADANIVRVSQSPDKLDDGQKEDDAVNVQQELRFVTKQERNHFSQIKKALNKEKPTVSKKDILNIVKHILTNRTSFNKLLSYSDTLKQMLDDFVPSCCISCCTYKKEKGFKRLEKLYENGMSRFNKEMDIVSILKTLKVSKTMFNSILAKEEKILIGLQRSAVISSDSTEDPATDYDKVFKTIQNEVNPMEQIFALGNLSRQLMHLSTQKEIRLRGVRLLKGFYTTNKRQLKTLTEHLVDKELSHAAFEPEVIDKLRVLIKHKQDHAEVVQKEKEKTGTGLNLNLVQVAVQPGPDTNGSEVKQLNGNLIMPDAASKDTLLVNKEEQSEIVQ